MPVTIVHRKIQKMLDLAITSVSELKNNPLSFARVGAQPVLKALVNVQHTKRLRVVFKALGLRAVRKRGASNPILVYKERLRIQFETPC